MNSDPFSFIVGQILSSAIEENDSNDRRAAREKVIRDSMVGFIWLKAWRIAHPTEYRDAKLWGIDYSHLKRTTHRTYKRGDKRLSDCEKERINQYYDAINIAKETFTANPEGWKWATVNDILAAAKMYHAKGGSYASFLQEYAGAKDAISKKGATNAIRRIWGLAQHGGWNQQSALEMATKVRAAGGTRNSFIAQHEGAYSFLKRNKLLGFLDPILPSAKGKHSKRASVCLQ